MKYSYEQKCELLDERASLQGFFDILCADEGAPAAYWLEDGKECSYSFGQLKEMAVCCGGRIESLGLGARDEWVGLALETCQNWPVIFWGLAAAGRKPLLLDPALDDEKLMYLLGQAGAVALICARPRTGISLPQAYPEDLLTGDTQPAEGSWADQLAFCTSGTTDTAKIYVFRGKQVCLQARTIIHAQEGEKITDRKSVV